MSYVYLLSDKKGLYYIGKTTDIRQRLKNHKSDIRHQGTCSSKCLDLDFNCEILEEYSNETDLAEAERKYYDIYREKYGDKLVNNQQPLRTQAEYNKQWRAENPDYNQQYYAENADKIKAKANQYHAENADKIRAKAKQKYNCECGGRYTHSNKTKHFKSLQHLLNTTPHLD